VARRPFTATELYIGLAIGVLIGAFRIAAKAECRHVPPQWVSRPLLWTCVGIEVALIVAMTATTVVVARTRAIEPEPDEPDLLPPELKKQLSASEQQAVRDSVRQARGAYTDKPVVHDPRSRA